MRPEPRVVCNLEKKSKIRNNIMYKKRIINLLLVLVFALSANAQFEKGKCYLGASLTGLNLSYSGVDNLNLGVSAQGGYLFHDNLMVLANASFKHSNNKVVPNEYTAGVGGRYYIIQNGIYLGLNAKWIHAQHSYNDMMPGMEIGYAFFINGSVTIEPALYYDQSFRNHSDYSTFGFKVGIGVYLK